FETLKNAGALSFCSYQISPSAANVGIKGGGTVFTYVTTSTGCAVLPSSGSAWLHASVVSSAPGAFQISVVADGNPSGSTRAGIVTVGDQLFRVIQDVPSPRCLVCDRFPP